MSLVAYTITALQRDVADAAGTGKQVIIGATCSMFLQPADTAVVLYDNAAGANGNTAKLTGSNGQVVVYVEPGQYRLSVNGINSYVTVAVDVATLGTAAIANVTTSSTDTVLGRVSRTGDFGAGCLTGTSPLISDLTVALPNGTYRTTGAAVGMPPSLGVLVCEVTVKNSQTGTFFWLNVVYQPTAIYHGSRAGASGAITWDIINHSGNTNANVFGGNATYDTIAQGFAISATNAIFYLPLNFVEPPTSYTVSGTLRVIDFVSSVVRGAGITSVIFSSATSKKLAAFVVPVSGMTAGDIVLLQIETAASKLTVNQ